MSYILDALKKIEHEKNRKLPDGRVSISGDLFQERKQPAARAGIWKTAAIIAVASLVVCAGALIVLQGKHKKSTVIIRPIVPQIPLPVSVKPPITTPPVSVPIQPQSVPVAMPTSAPSAAVPVSPKNMVTVGDDVSPVRKVRRAKKQVKTQPSFSKQPVQTVQAPADIKLSGIAWQDERAARRAVINGFLLKEGAVVSSARIIDIRPDRVRFSSPTGVFEIKLDAVLPVEVKK